MKRSERLARHYIRAADLRAIFVAQRGRVVRIGITRDPQTRERDLKRAGERFAGATWCNSSADAARVIRGVAEVIPGIETGVHATADRVRGAIVDFARAHKIGLGADDTVRQRAAVVVADIEARVKAMQSSGHLRGLNQEYREARAAAARKGVPFHSYGDHLERYKIRMLYELAGLTK